MSVARLGSAPNINGVRLPTCTVIYVIPSGRFPDRRLRLLRRILASLSLHHATLDERPALAGRLFRSLAPNGRLITAEVIVDESPEVREQQYEKWRLFIESQGEDGDAWYEKSPKITPCNSPSGSGRCQLPDSNRRVASGDT